MSKFRYPIFPDRIYTLQYEQYGEYQVSGEQIIAYFRRDAMLDSLLEDPQIIEKLENDAEL